jgi:UDP-3-O-[3-hydroxymyristoyl] glucosamine N-acyltransferase
MKGQGKPRALREIAEAAGARLIGDGEIKVSGVASIESAMTGDLVFVDDEKYLASALQSRATAAIAGPFAESLAGEKPLLISDHPKLAFARSARILEDCDPPHDHAQVTTVHATAVVHDSAVLKPGVHVEEQAVIGGCARIGDNTRIGAGSRIGASVTIGCECEVYPNVTIYPGTVLGDRVMVHAGAVLGSDGFGYVRDRPTGRYEKFPQVGRLVIEDDVEIGANTTIDRGALDETRIRRGVKIDNLVHIGHNCQIGEDVVIAAQTGISGSVIIEKGVVIAGQVGIAEHVYIHEGVIVGAQGGVPSNKILRGKGVVFWGTPARPIREYLKQLAVLARLAKKD